MKSWKFFKSVSAALAAVILLGSLPQYEVEAIQSVSLNIAKVVVPYDEIGEDRLVSVDVRIDGNDAGFLASEFGIVYDERLILESVVKDSSPGNVFEYTKNPEGHFAWFAGASADAASTACTGRQTLFTLVFSLPENYDIGDNYYVGYALDSPIDNSAYWYTTPEENQIEYLRGHSIAGSITIPDPSAPRMKTTELQMNQKDITTLEVENCDESTVLTWVSDHPDIVAVDNPMEGTIRAIAPGVCTIICIAGTAMLSCEVTVTEEYFYSVNGSSIITMSSPTQEIYLTYPNPEGTITWMSTRPDIVTVDNGKLTGISNGDASILATSNGITYMRQITVDFPDTTEPPTETEATTENPSATIDHRPATDPSGFMPDETTLFGDVDDNDVVDIVDVIALNKYLLIGESLPEAGIKAADVYADGKINATDSLTLLKYVVKIVNSLPVIP